MDTGYCHREAKRTDSDKRRMNSIGKLRFRNCFRIFAVAQADFAAQDADPYLSWSEQRTHNPKVVGSCPSGSTKAGRLVAEPSCFSQLGSNPASLPHNDKVVVSLQLIRTAAKSKA